MGCFRSYRRCFLEESLERQREGAFGSTVAPFFRSTYRASRRIIVDKQATAEAKGIVCLPEYTAGKGIKLGEMGMTPGILGKEVKEGGVLGGNTVANLAQRFTEVLVGLIASIAIFALVISGFMYIRAMGDEERIKKAKAIMMVSVAAVFIALMSYVIVNTLLAVLYSGAPAG